MRDHTTPVSRVWTNLRVQWQHSQAYFNYIYMYISSYAHWCCCTMIYEYSWSMDLVRTDFGYAKLVKKRLFISRTDSTVKPVLSGHSKISKMKIVMTNGSLMKVESIAECSPWSILQYFWPALSDNRSSKPILVFFLSDHLRQVLLYIDYMNTVKPVLSSHSKLNKIKIVMTNDSLMKVEGIAECSKGSILQYFWPALSNNWSWKPNLVFFLSGRLR